MDSIRILYALAGGICVIAAYSIAVSRRYRVNRRHHDRRSFRELMEAIGLWLVAVIFSLSFAGDVMYPTGADLHGLFSALSLGALLGVGIVMATEDKFKQ